jgi:uncharacterized SAM-binding protein YcdF (DUF218 family)
VRKRLGLVWRLCVGLLACIGALFVLATVTPIDFWWATALSDRWNDPPGDVLIVLGGSTIDYGLVGGSSYWRGVYAVLCYRQAHYRRVVVSGGPPGNSSAAMALRQFLSAQGVPEQVIQLEDRSTTTRENALFTAELLRGAGGRKLLLTSDYHMYRAHRAFASAGLDVIPVPFPDAIKRAQQPLQRWQVMLDLVWETAKIAYYYAHGWI